MILCHFLIALAFSRPAYSKEQLAQFKAEDNRKIEFEGKEYTKYEASQLQKRIESEARRQKDRATIAKASGDDVMRREAQYRINLLTNKYAKLSKESGLPTKMERMQMKGFRKVKAETTPEGVAKYKAIENRKNDEKQYQKYIGILGADNMPKTLDEFQKIKYNDIDKWDDMKYYVRNIGDRPVWCVKLDRELQKIGFKTGEATPYVQRRAYVLEDLSNKDSLHIMKRMKERNITADDIQSYVDESIVVFEQRKGQRLAYYSENGVTVLTKTNDYPDIEWIAKTTWNKHDYDEDAIKILEVAKKYVQ